MEKLFKTLGSAADFPTTQQFTTGRDAPPLHPLYIFLERKKELFLIGERGVRSNRRASTRPCQSDTAHTRPYKAALGGSEYPTTPRKALRLPVAPKTLLTVDRLGEGLNGGNTPNSSQRFRFKNPPLSAFFRRGAKPIAGGSAARTPFPARAFYQSPFRRSF